MKTLFQSLRLSQSRIIKREATKAKLILHLNAQIRAIILRDAGDVETESESDDDPMPPLEDANEYPVDGN